MIEEEEEIEVRKFRLLAFTLVLSLASNLCADCPECHPALREHSEEFEKKIYSVAEGVWVAVGYGVANSILIEGDDGVIVVDTMESVENAIPVKEAFDSLVPGKPTKAIIYTHNHADHCFGASVFAGEDQPLVISHESTIAELTNILNVIQPIIRVRSMRQLGGLLSEEDLENSGIGPLMGFNPKAGLGLIIPNQTFAGESVELEISGVKLVLVHAPGETDDQIFVWLPEKKVLLPGDNFYKAFPNLYAIRGTKKRDVVGWVASLDKMRALNPEHLVPSHTRPISGCQEVHTRLTNYRDAIQFVHDRTVHFMNQGFTPEEIVQYVHLPEPLASDPFLQEYYGKVEWSVRGIYASYLGWFSGEARDLYAVAPIERARRTAQLAGGVEALQDHAAKAFADGDIEWALELADTSLQLQPGNSRSTELKICCLEEMARSEISANGRNYLLTLAREEESNIIAPYEASGAQGRMIAMITPIEMTFERMKVALDPVKSRGVDLKVSFYFTDLNQSFMVHVRHGVLEVHPYCWEPADVHVQCPSLEWKLVLGGYDDVECLLEGFLNHVEGPEEDLKALVDMLAA